MKAHLLQLNKAFDNKLRLGIMSVLRINERMDFTSLKELTETTDGNLATHLRKLEDLEYVKVDKRFVNRKPRTEYSLTATGKKAFDAHLAALEKILNEIR